MSYLLHLRLKLPNTFPKAVAITLQNGDDIIILGWLSHPLQNPMALRGLPCLFL